MKQSIAILALLLFAFCAFAGGGRKEKVKYYNNGAIKYKMVKEGNQMYRLYTYYKNGQLRESGFYKRGKRHGFFEDFTQDGERKTTAYYHHDKKDGVWTFYSPEGVIEKFVYFNENEIDRLVYR